MAWYSSHGTGATLHGIQRTGDGRVRFTSWLTLFWIPLVPLRSWSGRHVGRQAPRIHGLADSQLFIDLRREPHDWGRILSTFAWGITGVLVATVPAAAIIAWTDGRRATTVEFVLALASCVWVVAVIKWCERASERKLESSAVVMDVSIVAMEPLAASDAPRDDLKWHQRELPARGIGAVALVCGSGLAWLGIVSPLEAAARHAETVSLSLTTTALAPFALGVGVLYVALGERARSLLRAPAQPSRLGWLIMGGLVGAGLLTYWWLCARLRMLGYAV